ncbi:MAG: MBL fold metallo-hydrolase [Lachnospiraceae bacterium]|nr:MBL fold metallo-hydrolase [Lachnospiraceae bacterium]
MIKLDKNIEYLPAEDNPLSADVYIIYGEKRNFIIDTGSNDEAYKLIKNIDNKTIVITHFHADHIGNLKRIDIEDKNLYVGKYTKKSTGRGTIVNDSLTFKDDNLIRVSRIPSSHAKDCLVVSVNNKWLFLGDSFYASAKGFNVSLLHDEIEFLEKEPFSHALVSHDNTIYSKEQIINTLKYFYSKRIKNEPYIKIN